MDRHASTPEWNSSNMGHGAVMGYRLNRKTKSLTFEDTEYDGAEVTVFLSISFADMFRVQDELMDDPIKAYTYFGESILIDWNLEGEDGESLPANAEQFLAVPDRVFTKMVFDRWVEAMVGVPDPLEPPSLNGSTSEVEPNETAVLSSNHQN